MSFGGGVPEPSFQWANDDDDGSISWKSFGESDEGEGVALPQPSQGVHNDQRGAWTVAALPQHTPASKPTRQQPEDTIEIDPNWRVRAEKAQRALLEKMRQTEGPIASARNAKKRRRADGDCGGAKKDRSTRSLNVPPLPIVRGMFYPRSHFPVLITSDFTLRDARGSIIFTFRKNVIPTEVRDLATDVLKYAPAKAELRRRSNGGVPPLSGIAGYYDYMGTPEKEKCRRTAFTSAHLNHWPQIFPLLRMVDQVYKQTAPDHHSRQYHAVPEPVRLHGTAFSTITVNESFRTAAHTDAGDFDAGLGALTVLSGHYHGCYLGLIEFGVAVDIRPGDVLLFDTHYLHGNTEPYISPPSSFYRLSCVFYYRFRLGETKCLKTLHERYSATQPSGLPQPPLPDEHDNGVNTNSRKAAHPVLLSAGLFHEVLKPLEGLMGWGTLFAEQQYLPQFLPFPKNTKPHTDGTPQAPRYRSGGTVPYSPTYDYQIEESLPVPQTSASYAVPQPRCPPQLASCPVLRVVCWTTPLPPPDPGLPSPSDGDGATSTFDALLSQGYFCDKPAQIPGRYRVFQGPPSEAVEGCDIVLMLSSLSAVEAEVALDEVETAAAMLRQNDHGGLLVIREYDVTLRDHAICSVLRHLNGFADPNRKHLYAPLYHWNGLANKAGFRTVGTYHIKGAALNDAFIVAEMPPRRTRTAAHRSQSTG